MSTRQFGPEFELGPPQWGVMYGSDGLAHWWRLMRRDNPDWAATPCGSEVFKPLLYHPGEAPLCRLCAARYPAPHLRVGNSIVDWMSREAGPPSADRIRHSPRS